MDRRRPGIPAPMAEPDALSGVLLRGLRDALRGQPMKATARSRLEAMDFIRKSPGRFSSLTERGLAALQQASKTDA